MFWEKDDAVEDIERMAGVQRDAGNTAQAKSLYTCLIAMIKRAGGDNREKLAVNFYRLGETYADEGNYDAAQTYYKRAAEIWDTVHPNCESPLAFRRALESMQGLAAAEDEERATNDEEDQHKTA